jgi:hypothetical protein
MYIVTVIVGILLGAMFLMMGTGKVSGKMDAMRDELGLSEQIWKIDGTTGALGGAGVLLGLIESLSLLGVLAGIGLAVQAALAVGFHVKRGDTPKELIPAAMSMLMAIVYVVARIASAA